MLPSRGARWSRNAVPARTQLIAGSQTARSYSVVVRTSLRSRPGLLNGRSKPSMSVASRSFSSSPHQQWSLWSGSTPQAPSRSNPSEFATTSPNEYAQYGTGWQNSSPASQATPTTQAIPTSQAIATAPAPEPGFVADPPPDAEHHGTPLTGPEHLLPDPVPHAPAVELTNPLESVPEKIGYLKELGLDYGWGTSTPMQWVLEHLHMSLGLPWYASAMAAAVLVRLLFLRMQIKGSDSMAKYQQIKPEMDPLMEELKAARTEGDTFKTAQLQKQISSMRKLIDMKPGRTIIQALGQATLGFGIWRNLRGMSELPVPALETEKFLWLRDMSVPDSHYILPILSPFLMYWNMKQASAAAKGVNAASPQMQRIQDIMRRVFPAISFVVVLFQPAIVQLYFITSSLVNMAVQAIMRSRQLRQTLGMTQIPIPAPKVQAGDFNAGARSAGLSITSRRGAPIIQGHPSNKGQSQVNNTSRPSISPPAGRQNISWLDRQLNQFSPSKLNPFAVDPKTQTSPDGKKLTKSERIAEAKRKEYSKREEEAQKREAHERLSKNERLRAAWERQRETEQAAEEERIRAMESSVLVDLDEQERVETDGRGRGRKRGKGGKGRA